MSRDWTLTANQLPEEDKAVQTMDSGGHVQDLIRKGNLWFFTDFSMYVYYTPKFWKDKEANNE